MGINTQAEEGTRGRITLSHFNMWHLLPPAIGTGPGRITILGPLPIPGWTQPVNPVGFWNPWYPLSALLAILVMDLLRRVRILVAGLLPAPDMLYFLNTWRPVIIWWPHWISARASSAWAIHKQSFFLQISSILPSLRRWMGSAEGRISGMLSGWSDWVETQSAEA